MGLYSPRSLRRYISTGGFLNKSKLSFSFSYGLQRLFCCGCAEEQIIDGGCEGGEFAFAFNLSDYLIAFPHGFNLEPDWGFEVVG